MALQSVNRVVYDLTFTADALAEIPENLRSTNYMLLLQTLVERWDAVQLAATSLAYSRFLDNASGDILDGIASRFFIDRGDKTDNEMKAAIQLFGLRQDMEGGRDEIYELLLAIAGDGGYVHIYKGDNNRVEVTVSSDCIDFSEISLDMEDLFPINTNLHFMTSSILGIPFGVKSVNDTEDSDLIGSLGSVNDADTYYNTIATSLVDNERTE